MDVHTPYSLSDWLNYLSHNEIDFLTRLVKTLPDSPNVINIGAGGGTSALTFLLARPDLHLITIDIQNEVTPVGGLGNEKLLLDSSGGDYAERYQAIHGDSKLVGREWSEHGVDMVFIDGGHSYDECKGDISVWLPCVKMGGVIAVHDYAKERAYLVQHPDETLTPELAANIIKAYPGVDRAVDELLLDRYPLVDCVDTLIAFTK